MATETAKLAAKATPADRAGEHDGRRGARTARAVLLVAGFLTTLVILPAAWLVGAWALGPKLNHDDMPFLTPLLFVIVLVGMPASIVALGRMLLAVEARLAARAGLKPAFHGVRRPQFASLRPPTPILDNQPVAPLGARRRALSTALVALMFAGTFIVWLGAPVGSIWIASQLSSTSQPGMLPYALIALGTALAMVVGVRLLAIVQVAYARVTGAEPRGRHARSKWLESQADERAIRRSDRGLETVMVLAVIVASILLTIWFFWLADPNGLIPPELQMR